MNFQIVLPMLCNFTSGLWYHSLPHIRHFDVWLPHKVHSFSPPKNPSLKHITSTQIRHFDSSLRHVTLTKILHIDKKLKNPKQSKTKKVEVTNLCGTDGFLELKRSGPWVKVTCQSDVLKWRVYPRVCGIDWYYKILK